MTAANQFTAPGKSSGFFSRFSPRRWFNENVAPAQQITQADTTLFGAGVTTVASLLGQGRRAARSRQLIYEKWMRMEADPIISSAISVLVTAALGGHETTGDIIFIEKKPIARENAELEKMVDEIAANLGPIFNQIAYTMAFTGAIYGDAYARIYLDERGVIDLLSDEMVRPQLVQPFERGGKTIGFAVSVGDRNFERLDITQMARMKMPRTQWIPQFGVVEKSLRLGITEDDLTKAPILPSMVGGSFLYRAEEPYDNLYFSLLGLVGQRWMDSIDEQMLMVNTANMTQDQRTKLLGSVIQMLTRSKELAEDAVKSGRPVLSRIRHLIPIFNEKQAPTLTPAGGGAGRTSPITIDDVMLHARLLAGSLGVDLSMIGFADQMSGGLGEGGFFRVSAQAAERARVIRTSLEAFFDSVINIHTLKRYKRVFSYQEKPWDVNFYSTISALEAEKQRTRLDAVNSGSLLAQTIQLVKDMGADKEFMETFLCKTMQLDEDQAKLYAKIVDQKPPQDAGEDPMGGM
jgi:hypothetical protein